MGDRGLKEIGGGTIDSRTKKGGIKLYIEECAENLQQTRVYYVMSQCGISMGYSIMAANNEQQVINMVKEEMGQVIMPIKKVTVFEIDEGIERVHVLHNINPSHQIQQ